MESSDEHVSDQYMMASRLGGAVLLLWILTRLFLASSLASTLRAFTSSQEQADPWALILRSLSPLGGRLRMWPNSHAPPPHGHLMSVPPPRNSIDYTSDFGRLVRAAPPRAILHPTTASDISALLRAINVNLRDAAAPKPTAATPPAASRLMTSPITVAARGHAHSLHGQAHAPGGIVVDMESLACAPCRVNIAKDSEREAQGQARHYADVAGGALWIDVLRACLAHGVAPRSWTDYLYLTVGGTLSNAGVSGQAFRHGPQISNVLQLQVVTGKGDVVTCSKDENSDLFYATLGGLGQFGIITSARIPLEPAPSRVKWVRALYSDFESFRKDQEYLISQPQGETFDYVEGFVVPNSESTDVLENWRSSLLEPLNVVNPFSTSDDDELLGPAVPDDAGILYYLEVTKNYNEAQEEETITKVTSLLSSLNCIRSSVHVTDVSYLEFLNRVHVGEEKLRARGLWDIPHPWLNLFVPSNKIVEFDSVVFKKILGKRGAGPIIIYPMNKNKWDERMSAAIPDGDIFYLVAILRSALCGEDGEDAMTVEEIVRENEAILQYCESAGIGEKQYLPRITHRKGWVRHFGREKWAIFERRKATYDPHSLLAPGQCIFHSQCVLDANTNLECHYKDSKSIGVL